MAAYLLLALVFAADRLTKRWAAAHLAAQGPTELHPLLSLTPSYNRGVAFGLFQGSGTIVGWLSLVVVGALLWTLIRTPPSQRLLRISLGLLLGGALGNMVDRIIVGQVFDFLTSPLLPSIFNVADVAINLGIALLLLASIRHRHGAGRRGNPPRAAILPGRLTAGDYSVSCGSRCSRRRCK